MSVFFTQYIRPDGKQREIQIVLDTDTEAKAHELAEAECRFEAEMLSTGLVSFECRDYARIEDDDPLLLSSELCENGPLVPESVKMLILAAHRKWQRLNLLVA